MSSRSCQRCGRGAVTGNNRSHSNIATKRTFRPNIQVKTIQGKRQKLCVSCIREMAKKQTA